MWLLSSLFIKSSMGIEILVLEPEWCDIPLPLLLCTSASVGSAVIESSVPLLGCV